MGAGNTWSRFLIEQATGFYTGSSFNDGTLKKSLKGEGIGANRHELVIAIKSHNIQDGPMEAVMYSKMRKVKHSKCVIVIRNPFDTFMAEFARMNSGHTGAAKWVTQPGLG